MSGLFQRIARRQADRPDEPGPAEEPAGANTSAHGDATDAAPPAEDATDATAPATAAPHADDAPTERIEPLPASPADGEGAAARGAAAATPLDDTSAPAPDAAPAAPADGASAPAPDAAPTAPADGASAPPPAGESTTPADASPAPDETTADDAAPRRPGFRERGRMRRRLRYLRNLRELQVRDLGGLVFDLRRFERKRDDLVAQKLDQLRACDDELHALELALGERRELRDLREPGIGGTCPRCFAIFGSADRFCSSCGAALGGAVQGPAQVPAPPQPPSDAAA